MYKVNTIVVLEKQKLVVKNVRHLSSLKLHYVRTTKVNKVQATPQVINAEFENITRLDVH